MTESVAWAGVWTVVGFGVGYFVAWLRGCVRYHFANVELAKMLRLIHRNGAVQRLPLLADQLDGRD